MISMICCTHIFLKNFTASFTSDVLRGPVIGPINRKDLATSQKGLDIVNAFPDIKIDSFGFTIDPENPYRCYYMQRWRATQYNRYGCLWDNISSNKHRNGDSGINILSSLES